MVKNSKDLLSNIYGTAPYNLQANQRVTVSRADLYELNNKINNYFGIEDTNSTLSLSEIINKISSNTLIFENASTNLNLGTLDLNTDLNTYTQVFTCDSNYAGFKQLTVNVTYDSLPLKENFPVTLGEINANTKYTTKTFTTNVVAPETLGAKNVDITLNLEDAELELTNLNANTKIASSGLGFNSVKINPKLNALTITPDMISSETEKSITPKTNAIGFSYVSLPKQEENKVADIILSSTEVINDNAEIFNINSIDDLATTEATLQFVIKYLGEHRAIPAADIIDYIALDGTVVNDYAVTPGDTVCVKETLEDESIKFTYYLYTGLSTTKIKRWELIPDYIFESSYFKIAIDEMPIGAIDNIIAGIDQVYSADEDKLGFRQITVKNPGSFDFNFNSPAKLISYDNDNIDSLILNFNDSTKAVHSVTIPKIKASNVEVSAQRVKEAILDKQEYIVIETDTAEQSSNPDEAVIINKTLLNSVKIMLPSFEDGEFIAKGTKDDIAILETTIESNANILNDSSVYSLSFEPTSSVTPIETVSIDSTKKASYYVDKSAKQTYRITVSAPEACELTVYQASIPGGITPMLYESANTLFTFKYPGNNITYYIDFSEDFSIDTVVSSNEGELGDTDISTSLVFNNFEVSIKTGDDTQKVSNEELETLITNIGDNISSVYYYGLKANFNYEGYSYALFYHSTEDTDITSSISFTSDAITGTISSNLTDLSTITLNNIEYTLAPATGINPYAINTYCYSSANVDPEVSNIINTIYLSDSTITFSDSEEIYYYSIYNLNNTYKAICIKDTGSGTELVSEDEFKLNLTTDGTIESVSINGQVYQLFKFNIYSNYIATDSQNNSYNVINEISTELNDSVLTGTIYFKPINI